jgi:hypothetical protein
VLALAAVAVRGAIELVVLDREADRLDHRDQLGIVPCVVHSPRAVAADLGVSLATFYRWLPAVDRS